MKYWLDISYATFVITYLTGLTFYIRFDIRRRPLRRRLLGLHLIMTVFTFIFLTGAMAVTAFPMTAKSSQHAPKQSTMLYLVRQHRNELKSHGRTNTLLNPPKQPQTPGI